MFIYCAGCLSQAVLSLIISTICLVGQGETWEELSRLNNRRREWKEEVKRVQPPSGDDCRCRSGEISCLMDCHCVLTSRVCNGIVDCPGGHDEAHCAKNVCQGRYACDNGICISHELTCDGVNDCGDRSDETMCRAQLPSTPVYNCSGPQMFNCSDGAFCIPAKWRCDGDSDCYDHSDEVNCVHNTSCQPTHFKCRTGKCIGRTSVCDGETDCEDASDEINCPLEGLKKACTKTEFNCSTAGRCVALHYRCDGEDDCGDWSDERACGNTTSCLPDNFRCNSGRCIENGWVCDGAADCDEGEDEKDCPHLEGTQDCPKGTVWCPSVCVSDEWKCDGELDCPGGEDEADCPEGVTCDEGMFTCSPGECLYWGQICDGHHNCLNGKDEMDCSVTECSSLSCSYACHRSDEGVERCLCKTGFTLAKDNITCVDVDECLLFYPCSQLCENNEGSFKCSCVAGYSLRPDRLTCKAQSPPARLIFATRDDVREINLSGQEYPPIALNLENAIAVDFHYRRGLVYWTDVTIDAILMAYRNGSGKTEIVRWGLQQPCGLAVDWYNDHIYWVDSITRRVEVANLDGANRRPLIWTNLQKPRSIVVHPAKSIIIWTDWGENARIERASMDGTGRKVLIGERLFWPNGITIDYPTETLYWVDAKHHVIEAAHVDGSKRRKVNEHKIPHPFGITVFEDRLYWTDWKMRSIRSINKRTGRDSMVVHSDVAFPMGIKSMHPQRQPLLGMVHRTGCAWNNGGCSYLCLPNPHSYGCFCPHGLYLLEDERTCSDQPDLLLIFAQRNTLRMISLQTELKASSQAHFVHKSLFKTSDSDTPEEEERPRMDNVIPVDGVHTAMALDFDDAEDMIYWTDVTAHSISRAHLNGSGQQVLVSTNLELPGGLAVDWINNKLYWTDDGADRVEVSNLDGSHRGILIWEGLHHPRDIVVHPEEGLLFWSEWGANASIERVCMDGSERRAIVTSNLTWPNGLAVDYESSRLFWLDARYKVVESADFNGKRRAKQFSNNLVHPFGLALYKDFIFWSDWEAMGIYMAEKSAGLDSEKLVKGLKDLMDVRVFHRRERNKDFENPCSLRNGGCSHLCLLKPERRFSCACPTGLLLQEDGKKCRSSPSEWLVFAHRTAVRTLALDTPYRADVVLHLPTLHNVLALDIDSVSGDIFLPDSGTGCILRCSIDGLRCDAIVTTTVTTVEGIAVEATSRKIYWTDYGRKSIEVSELDGSNRRVLFTQLDKPRAITTHYPSGRFFWTDWADHRPRIEVADLDGQRRKVFVSQKVAWPNGLAVDWTTSELFWTDAKLNHIQAIRLDGLNRRTVLTGKDVTHPYGVAVLGDWVYWTDWVSKSLLKARKNSGNRITTLRKEQAGLMDLKAQPGPLLSQNVCGVSNGGCSHLCLRNPEGFSCACPTGLLLKNGHECANSPSKYLIVASKGLLRRISLDIPPLWDVGIEIPGTRQPVSVDIHYKKQQLFFTDSDSNSIRVVSLNSSSHPETFPTHGFTSPDGLAVDWVSDNLYWTDAAMKVIEVARIGSYSQKAIVRADLQEPRGIAVFPQKGLLFWTDWGNESRIERSALDGSDRTVILSSDIGWPNGLVLDTQNDRIYWNDAQKDTLETADLNGENRVQLLDKLPHPFGITMLNQHIYWTDWDKQSVERADKDTGKNCKVIVTGIQEPMEVVAVEASIQTGSNPCAQQNGGCSHLCLFRPQGDVVCACPDVPTTSCSTSPLFKVDAPSSDPVHSTETPSTNLHAPHGFITVVVVVGVLAVLLIAVLVTALLWLRCRRARKAAEGVQPPGGELTYTNPTYAASHSDVNADRKPFTWRRLHTDNPQGRLFDEKGEVTALISEGSSVEHDSPPPTPPTHARPTRM